MATPDTILSLSGGGVKAIMQLKALVKIEDETGLPISEIFPDAAGTSAGGLLLALLYLPKEPGSKEPLFTAREALKLFKDSVADIFPQHWYHPGMIGKIFSHQYSQKPLKELLDKYLGNMKCKDLLGNVLITAFEPNTENPIQVFGHNTPEVEVRKVILATTAAPTYFKGVTINGKFYIDGGVGCYSNRPEAEAIKYLKEGLNREQQREMLDNMTLVSLNFQSPLEKQDVLPPHLDGLIPQLANGLVNNMMKASENAATKEVKIDLLEEQFFNFALPVPKGCTKLDNSKPENMAKLEKSAEQYLESNKELIKKLCTTLVEKVKAREESSKLQESQTTVDKSSACDESVKVSDNIDKKGQDKDTHVISEEFEAKLAINLNEQQVDALKEGLMKLTPKEYEVLQTFLKGLNDAQLVALSVHLPLIADGNFKNTNISEFSNFQNKFLQSFSSMFEPEDNVINDALSCAQQYNQHNNEEVPCDGRGSDFSHAPPEVY
ncbi:patatin-like phospholipase family protein [Candidatus Tisiphia endosymbiont of Metellina segmentata]|uniref:patatin-like phospholipase family protein n=1 Tax=Candidatus Tisiphia endosymbiont of Metellina segmentata TaxID=3066274 RepID=UPI00313B4409